MTLTVPLYVNENSLIRIHMVISECHYTIPISALEYTYHVVVSKLDVWYNISINRFTCLHW